MDANSVSSQMFLILLSFITLGPESQISVFKQCKSNIQMSGIFFGRACAEAKIWRCEKKNFARHFALFNFSRLSLPFIILSCMW